MDVAPYLPIRPAPCAVFDHLPARHDRPRYMVAGANGFVPLSWAEHAADIRHLSLFCRARGVPAGCIGAIFAPNDPLWMAAALGLQAASLVMVPIYPASTASQAAYIVQHSGAQLVFVATPELLERVLMQWPAYEQVEAFVVLDDTQPLAVAHRLRERGHAVPDDDTLERRFLHVSRACAQGKALDLEAPDSFDRGLEALDLDQVAMMLYTSGTTGNPKGVPLTHRNVGVNGRDWLRCNAPLLPDEGVDLLWLPMSHIFGFGEACHGNTLGWTTYMSTPARVLAEVPIVRPNIFMSVPAYWEKLAGPALQAKSDDEARDALLRATGGRLQFCLSGGAGLKREVKELFHRCGILIIEGYGLTETSPTLTLNRPDAFRFDTVGQPLPSVEIRLADDGEILARGPNVFSGYHRDPEATAAAFTEDGWFRTGDVGRFTEDGFLQIVDRKKEILVTAGGKNVAPANVEREFAGDPLFTHVVVYGDGKKYLTAGIWLDEAVLAARLQNMGVPAGERDEAVDKLVSQTVEAVNERLAKFEQIKRFKVMSRPLTVEDGLLTSTLKLRRKKIYEAFASELEDLYR